MTGISRRHRSRASRLRFATECPVVFGLVVAGCGGRPASKPGIDPSAARIVPLAAAIVLETAGPPPSDTTVTFATGAPHVIVVRHGPPENVVFAELTFPPGAFRADSGVMVRVEVRPRPGVYGLDVVTSLPLGTGASVTFRYARYFLAPQRARSTFGSDVLYERALAVGQLQAAGPQLALLPSTRPAADNLRGPMPAAGTYLVAAAP
ncbi:MAG TPA: hypothetical protein VMY76_05260 [Gemmatimonadales bacterium]|nr:hypothetical protein [Gemmatimonadales bacterium]